MFGTKPNASVRSTPDKGDHLVLGMSDILEDEGIAQYQSLIGTLHWLISIDRFDIQMHVMTVYSFRVAPRVGHLDW